VPAGFPAAGEVTSRPDDETARAGVRQAVAAARVNAGSGLRLRGGAAVARGGLPQATRRFAGGSDGSCLGPRGAVLAGPSWRAGEEKGGRRR
jgi:hypothetical protein